MDFINKIKHLKDLNINKSLKLIDIINFLQEKQTMNDIESIYAFLIKEIYNIQSLEYSVKNTELLKNNSNSSIVLENCEDGKYGSKMYLFNNSKYTNYIFGDIHGDSVSILLFLDKINFVDRLNNDEKVRLIFLGDYVDRGKEMYKTLELILLLKYIFAHKVFLIRGNHDGGTLVDDDNYKLCVGRGKTSTDDTYFLSKTFNLLKKEKMSMNFIRTYLTFFNNLCHVALLKHGKENIILVHGGIPRPRDEKYDYLNKLSDLSNTHIVDNLGSSVVHNMLWSDPAESRNTYREGRRFYFYRDNFDNFCSKFNINLLIRGHEAFVNGYKSFFDNKIMCIFSSGKSDSICPETYYTDINPCILEVTDTKLSIIRNNNNNN